MKRSVIAAICIVCAASAYQVTYRFEPIRVGDALFRYDHLTGASCMLVPRNACANATVAAAPAPTATESALDRLADPTATK